MEFDHVMGELVPSDVGRAKEGLELGGDSRSGKIIDDQPVAARFCADHNVFVVKPPGDDDGRPAGRPGADGGESLG